ncbi:MAG TPA: hypothetical protein VNV43_04685, partial [Candidatus Acidoferrales bacterium]|nr:hypothetical protein [Candidatus Acidoferrales bacterium]
MLVTLPFVMLLLDFWPLQRFVARGAATASTFRRLSIEKIPFLVLAVIFCVVTFLVQRKAGAVVALKYFPMPARLANAMVSYAHYLEKTIWPDPLAMLYPWQRWTPGEIAGSTGIVVGFSLLAIWSARRRPYIFVGWFWFVGMLIPVIGIVQVGLQAMADHYAYLPLIGIFIVLAWGLMDSGAAANPQLRLRPLPVVAAVVVVALLGVASAMQVCYWKNSETLFTHAVRVTGHNTTAHYILGALYDSRGQTDFAAAQFTAAIE